MIMLCALSTQLFSQQVKNVIISGKVLTQSAKEVKLYINDNPITPLKTFTTRINNEGSFSIKIPITNIATGNIYVGKYYHEICLLPGDNFTLKADGDDITYSGKGAEKNNYLLKAERNGAADMSFYYKTRKTKLTPTEFLKQIETVKQKRLEFFQNYDKTNFEKEFIQYFKASTEIVYQSVLMNYPRIYAYKNKIKEPLNLPLAYKQLNNFSYVLNEKNVFSSTYINNIKNVLHTKFRKFNENQKFTTTKSRKKAFNKMLTDSLSGLTREYVLVSSIHTELLHNLYDSISIQLFKDLKPSAYSKIFVDKALDKFNNKQKLINKPLHKEFAKTLLVDANGNELSFDKMMKKFKGKVVYLDMWNMECGPCRASMSHSRDLKEKLKNEPIEFVYLYVGNRRKNTWEKIYKTSFSNQNHYQVQKGFGSSLNQFMGISWVPNYMIFDKKGKLISFSEDRPSASVKEFETPLEKKLKNLSIQ